MTSPLILRRVFGGLLRLDRYASWVLAVAMGGWAGWTTLPMTVETLSSYTAALELTYVDVYSQLHDRPFATCDSYSTQREETLSRIRVRQQEIVATHSALMAVPAWVAMYDAEMRRHYAEGCRVAWRLHQNPANLQKVFAQNYPLYVLVARLSVSEVYITVLQFAAGWLGVIAAMLLTVAVWRSVLAPAASLVATSMLLTSTFVSGMAVSLAGSSTMVAAHSKYLYPAVTVLLTVVMLAPILRPGGPGLSRFALGLLVAAFGFHGLIYKVIDPPTAGMAVTLCLLYVAAVGLLHRRWQVIGAAAAAAVLHAVLTGVFNGPASDIYSAVTTYDHLGSEAYRNIMVYMGFLERPSPLGLFYMDEMFSWVLDQNPILVQVAPFMAGHHSFGHTGKLLMWEALSSEPIMVLDAVVRRLYVQLLYRPLWYEWQLRTDWIYTFVMIGIGLVNAWAWRIRRLFWILTPISLAIVVNQFAVNTLMTLVHTHPRWNVLGVMLGFVFAPVYLFAAVQLAANEVRRRRDRELPHAPPVAAMAVFPAPRRSRMRVAAGLAVATVIVALVGDAVVGAVRTERVFAQAWMDVHRPSPDGVPVFSVVSRLETLRRQAGDPRGEIAMWIASIVRMYENRYLVATPEEPARRAQVLQLRAECARIREEYYRQAVAASPGNPHFLFAAKFLRITGWQGYLREALRRFPDSSYATSATAALWFDPEPIPAEERELLARDYERLTWRFMQAVGPRIPGFESAPRVIASSGSVTVNKGPAGTTLIMGSGAEAFLSVIPVLGSPDVHLVGDLDVREGAVFAGLALWSASGERLLTEGRPISPASQRMVGRFHVMNARPGAEQTGFGMWLRSGEQGTTVEIRSYYPIVPYPAHYYRSGLEAARP